MRNLAGRDACLCARRRRARAGAGGRGMSVKSTMCDGMIAAAGGTPSVAASQRSVEEATRPQGKRTAALFAPGDVAQRSTAQRTLQGGIAPPLRAIRRHALNNLAEDNTARLRTCALRGEP
mmetsp:Transcript_15375/g.41265  ORF Transcript_15375/g.41265 Transcript_15375/m.41265 type:complete len:121 (+) Transcript_15375:148-510(+)